MTSSTATRERILDSAMQLFGEHGFRGTSVAAIERAAGLSPGAGGLYHHFPSKDAVLQAGLARHLARVGALRDIRRLFAGVGDLRVGLTVIARYVLTELEAESDLIQVLLSEARARPELVRGAAGTMVESTYGEFAAWLGEEWGVEPEQARQVTAVALGSLLAHRLVRNLLPDGAPGLPDDESFVATWVEVTGRGLEPHRSRVIG